MKTFKSLFILSMAFAPAITCVSCQEPNNPNNNSNSQGFSKRVSGILNSSQLSNIKDQFSFQLTDLGRQNYQKAIEIFDQIYNQKYISSHSINNVLNDPEFKKYFIVSIYPKNIIYGHPITIKLEKKGENKPLPCISYEVRCPDRIQNGKMALDSYEEIYLDI
ncbi:hypothetical protein FJO69_01325 [[Mycoplasma] falconis]|uniref:Variable surface lipoprotein n=1 Tax=[Mycoplasma] falconis TaxID=92403 RepID=A0A501XAS0_9BACT|nr:hypothetical protein [[Mycoplasma] falconis]TPE57556.1 hypothetical protein FJO69_01325 [[Mycoplasma] falconis]